MIRILLMDEQKIFCESLQHLLESDEEISIVGIAQEGESGILLSQTLLPDLIIMDLQLPDLPGTEVIKTLKQIHSNIKILVLTSATEDGLLRKALEKGADGFLLKNITASELILSIRTVLSGFEVITKTVNRASRSGAVTIQSDQEGGIYVKLEDGLVYLSKRELRMIQLMVDGCTTTQIAKELHLAEGRVRNVMTELIHKMSLQDKIQLVVFALRHHLAQ